MEGHSGAVPAAAPAAPVREFAFDDGDFRAIARIALEKAGLSLTDSKRSLVYSRLAKNIRRLGLRGFDDYVALIESGQAPGEVDRLITALTTNVTAFFRERHHFDHLRATAAPELAARARNGSRVRLWSAAASSGEEAYSMAMCLLGTDPSLGDRDLKILATDINDHVLKNARAGRYPKPETDVIPDDLRRRFVSAPDPSDQVTLAPELGRMIAFRQLNLMADWPFSGPFDVIFCRNVAIYFDKPTQQRLWARLHQMLKDGGYLYIGHSERVTGPAEVGLKGIGTTFYRKEPAG